MARSERGRRRRVWRVLGSAVVATGLGVLAADQSDARPSLVLVGAACFAGVLLIGVGLVLSAGFEAPLGSLPAVTLRRRRTDRESGGLQRVTRTVERSLADVDRFNDRLRPWLLQLAGQRLRSSRGTDLAAMIATEPDTARTLLGDSLCTLIRQPATAAPTQQQLTEWITRIEQLHE